jgi:hypothetical protein
MLGCGWLSPSSTDGPERERWRHLLLAIAIGGGPRSRAQARSDAPGRQGSATRLRTLNLEGFPLYYPRKLVKRLNQPGELDPDRALLIAEALARQFPAA